MQRGLAILTLVLSTAQAGLESEWATYKKTYGKTYQGQEDAVRKNIWRRNMAEIMTHNVLFYKGESSYLKGENKFADLTPEEMQRYRNHRQQLVRMTEAREIESGKYRDALPKEVDWRKKGYVTEVRSQKGCGSCWAISAVGAVEGQHFNATGELVSLSTSNVLDCCTQYGCNGCGGGVMNAAFNYIIQSKGIASEKDYPYVDHKEPCRAKEARKIATISAFKLVQQFDEDALHKATAEIGPISTDVDASGFGYYKSGVFDYKNCSRIRLDHSVLVVGYGVEDGKDYWLVKNSWGKGWGEEGYIKMSRNKRNQCGIASGASYPVV